MPNPPPPTITGGRGGGAVTSHKIFVIGTGRSGTHWLGDILQSHPGIHVTVEAPPIFRWVTDMALDPRRKTALMPKLVARYRHEHAAVAPRHYADKSHPNIWHAEELAAALPDALFIGIRRSPYATVASMLKHARVLAWHDRWRSFPVPNRFLGITSENHHGYDTLPLATRCALRWKSHAARMDELVGVLGDRLLVVGYERLIEETAAEMARLNAFLALDSPVPAPFIKAESLDRWSRELTADEQRQIEEVTGIAPRVGRDGVGGV